MRKPLPELPRALPTAWCFTCVTTEARTDTGGEPEPFVQRIELVLYTSPRHSISSYGTSHYVTCHTLPGQQHTLETSFCGVITLCSPSATLCRLLSAGLCFMAPPVPEVRQRRAALCHHKPLYATMSLSVPPCASLCHHVLLCAAMVLRRCVPQAVTQFYPVSPHTFGLAHGQLPVSPQ